MDKVCFRDKRLSGTKTLYKHLITFELDANTSVYSAFNFLQSRHKHLMGKKFRTLFVMAHGITREVTLRISPKTLLNRTDFTGRIQLGKEQLSRTTAHQWWTIRNLVDNIIFYVCYPAQTPFGKGGTIADGRSLMRLLAHLTNANVYASDSAQTYTPSGLSFGRWEGKVFQFSPNGQVKQIPELVVRLLVGQL